MNAPIPNTSRPKQKRFKMCHTIKILLNKKCLTTNKTHHGSERPGNKILRKNQLYYRPDFKT